MTIRPKWPRAIIIFGPGIDATRVGSPDFGDLVPGFLRSVSKLKTSRMPDSEVAFIVIPSLSTNEKEFLRFSNFNSEVPDMIFAGRFQHLRAERNFVVRSKILLQFHLFAAHSIDDVLATFPKASVAQLAGLRKCLPSTSPTHPGGFRIRHVQKVPPFVQRHNG